MSAYRDETAALRHKLENATTRADRAEARLRRYERGREHRWNGDIPLFLARALLIAAPLGLAVGFALYFGVGVVMLGIFDDTRALMALFAFFVSPLFVAGPIAAWKTETPSPAGWGLALFCYLYMLVFLLPVGIFGLLTLLRARTRDAVFGPKHVDANRVRVATLEEDTVAEGTLEEDAAVEDLDELAPEVQAAPRTSRSAE